MKRTPIVLVSMIVALWVAAMNPTAAAGGGGSTLDFDKDYYAVGDTAHARAQTWASWEGMGTAEDGPYTAYLVRHQDLGNQISLPRDAVKLAAVSVTAGTEGRLNIATSFRIPDVSPGRWYVRVCNVGCRKVPGDLYDWGFTIASNPMEVRWMQRFDQLDRRVSQRVEASAFRVLRDDVTGLGKEVDAVAVEGGATDGRVAHLERNSFESVPWLVWLTVLIGVLAIAFAIFAMRTRRMLKRLMSDPLLVLHDELAEEAAARASREPAGVA